MDQSVEDALAHWPNVPAVYGWLSLDGRGRWRLHPQADAVLGGPGEAIGNTQILGFMNRNYGHDAQGRWYFQNGPQRVYARLDAAPYLLRLCDDGARLQTHTGASVDKVHAWWLDEAGRLYANADVGPCMVADRDLPALLAQLRCADQRALIDALENPPDPLADAAPLHLTHPALSGRAPLRSACRDDIIKQLGFISNPRPPLA